MSAIAHIVKQTIEANITRPPRSPVTTTEVRQMVRLRRQGLSLKQIADKLGRPVNTVCRHIKGIRP